MAALLIKFQPRVALKAALALARDPDDLPQVFTLIEAMSFDTLTRIANRLEATEAGRALLARRPDIVAQLADREYLASLPEGSVGCAYLAFVTRENISAQGIRDAAVAGTRADSYGALPVPLDYVFSRMRDTHDLWHVVTGFQGDVMGETALLAFLFAQTRNPAIGIILGIALFKLRRYAVGRALLRKWYRNGRRATWLPSVDWETLLARPLAEVRTELGIVEPAQYTPVRSIELRAAA